MISITPPDPSSTWARRSLHPQSPLHLILESITQPTPCPYLGLSHSMTFFPSIFLPLTFYREVLPKTLEFFPLSIWMRHLGPRLAEHIILTRTALSTVLPETYECTRILCIPKVWPLGTRIGTFPCLSELRTSLGKGLGHLLRQDQWAGHLLGHRKSSVLPIIFLILTKIMNDEAFALDPKQGITSVAQSPILKMNTDILRYWWHVLVCGNKDHMLDCPVKNCTWQSQS